MKKQSLTIALFIAAGLSTQILSADQEYFTLDQEETETTLTDQENIVSTVETETVTPEQTNQANIYKQFIEQKLFNDPRNKGSLWGRVAKFSGPAVACGYAIYDVIAQWQNNWNNIDGLIQEEALFAILGTAWYFLANQFISKPLNFKANSKDAFIKFMNNWPTYKKMTPVALYPIFDDIYEKMTKQGFTEEDIEVIIPQTLESINALLQKN